MVEKIACRNVSGGRPGGSIVEGVNVTVMVGNRLEGDVKAGANRVRQESNITLNYLEDGLEGSAARDCHGRGVRRRTRDSNVTRDLPMIEQVAYRNIGRSRTRSPIIKRVNVTIMVGNRLEGDVEACAGRVGEEGDVTLCFPVGYGCFVLIHVNWIAF